MSKKRIIVSALVVMFAILLNVFVIRYQPGVDGIDININITMRSNINDGYQIYYWQSDDISGKSFTEEQSEIVSVSDNWEYDVCTYSIPANTRYIRFDFGKQAGKAQISKVEIEYKGQKQEISQEQLENIIKGNQLKLEKTQTGLDVEMTGDDSYLIWHSGSWNMQDLAENAQKGAGMIIFKILACVVIDAIALFAVLKAKKLWVIPKEIYHNRKMILQLAKNDFKTRYAASYLGIFWAFVQPIITVLVYWCVFDLGLKAGEQAVGGIEVPFVLFLISGMVPWFFFQDALNGATGALTSYSYLVKKVVFKISILPIVKVISAVFVHLFFIVFAIIVFACYGYYPTLYMIQMLYYTAAVFLLVLGLSYFTCAIVVFFRDLSEIINIILQIGVWVTPIMWNMDSVVKSDTLKLIFQLNPMYYIVQGYRDALINNVWFWERPGLTIYFWSVTLVIGGVGMFVFKRLRVHFADVL